MQLVAAPVLVGLWHALMSSGLLLIWVCLSPSTKYFWTGSQLSREYKIQVSDDAQNRRDVVHVTTGKGGQEVHTFAPVTTRYVRMLGILCATNFGYSLWEFDVYPMNHQSTLPRVP
jgi:hypothetical protein